VEVPTVFILGDSTVCDQPKEPYASWGQMLTRFFKPEIAVANHAESGETLRSSTGAHRLEKVLGEMKPGDYLLMQYGHNDMKSKEPDALAAYKATLEKWIEQVREKGGIPVLITSMNRHRFEGGTVVNTLLEYPETVREVAGEKHAALIDLQAMSKTLYEALGPQGSIQAFKHDSENDPKFDGTHHSPYGAYELAKCVCRGIREDRLDLAKYLVEEVVAFDPAKPDPLAAFRVPPSPGFTQQRPLGD
jgi:lysophospholipase L1-like esterase